MRKFIFGALALILFFTGACFAQNPVALFDEGHGQMFLVGKPGDYGLTGLGAAFTGAGFTVKTSTGPITAETLKGVKVLVSSGGFTPFTLDEAVAVKNFVEGGGELVALLHIAQPYVKLLVGVEVAPSRGVISETENVLGISGNEFRVVNLEKHPLFNGISSFEMRGAWAVVNRDKDSSIIASTSPNAWLDINGNKQRDEVERLMKLGVVVAGKKGAGRYVVFGDDAVFQDKFLTGNNKTLANNLANWLK